MGEPTRKRSDGLATIQVVLEHARVELAASGPARFNLDRVIESSGVARSSIYRHFGSRAGLVATLELENWTREQAKSLATMRKYLLEATNAEDVLAAVEFALRVDGDAKGRRRRLRRVSSLVVAENVPASPSRCENSKFEAQLFWPTLCRPCASAGRYRHESICTASRTSSSRCSSVASWSIPEPKKESTTPGSTR